MASFVWYWLHSVPKTMDTNMRHQFQLHAFMRYLSIDKNMRRNWSATRSSTLQFTSSILCWIWFFWFSNINTVCVKCKYSMNYYKSLGISSVIDIFHWKNYSQFVEKHVMKVWILWNFYELMRILPHNMFLFSFLMTFVLLERIFRVLYTQFRSVSSWWHREI